MPVPSVLRGALVALLLMVPVFEARALDPARRISEYSQRLWTVREGLPQAVVRAVATTPDGYLWIGTDAGLARFDGVRFTVFDSRNTPSLSSDQIRMVRADRDGNLWIGTDGGDGLIRYRGGQFESFANRTGMPANTTISAFQDRGGRIWFGSWWGLSVFDGTRFVPHRRMDGLSLRHTYAAMEDAGGLWLGTFHGLVRLQRGQARDFPLDAGPGDLAVTALAVDGGDLWVATEGRGLVRVRAGSVRRWGSGEGLAHDQVKALHLDRDGSLWVGTPLGLSRVRGETIDTFTIKDGLAADNVRAITEDREGNLWLGTRGGLLQLRAGPFTSVSFPDALAAAAATAVLEAKDGTLWVGTSGTGLLMYRGGTFTSLTARQGLCTDFIHALAEDDQGAMWVGGVRGERTNLCRVKDGHVTPVTAAQGFLPNRPIHALGKGGRGAVLVGAGQDLFRGDSTRMVLVPFPDPEPRPFLVRALAEDGSGLWVGTEPSLRRLKDGRWTRYTRADGLSHDDVLAITPTGDGSLWMGTRQGLSRFRDGRFSSYKAAQGLFNDHVLQVLEDAERTLWLCTPRGVFRVRQADVDAFDRGLRRGIGYTQHGIDDGLKTYQCEVEGNPAGWKGQDGRLWFPTSRGVAWVHPARLGFKAPVPPVVIELVAVDGAPVGDGGGARPGRGDIEIAFTALSFAAPEAVRFKYRLEPFDRGWVDGGERRRAHYTNMPPGWYRFAVVAGNRDGVWNEAGAKLGFRLRPHLHQTGWFRALATTSLLALGVGAGVFMHRRRLNRVRATHVAVLSERTRIAREIHDTLAQGFTGISMHLEAAVLRMPVAPDEARANIDRARTLVRTSLTDARRAVWDLRMRALEEGDLLAALSDLVRSMGADIPIRLQVNGRPPTVAPEREAALLRIAQEALANALKHARASRIVVELSFLGDHVTLEVRDDGAGFDSAARRDEGHFGLRGIRERAEALGGTMTLATSPGGGTALSVMIPVSSEPRKSPS